MNSKVKALQMKLQQQNMRLGLPPPTAIPSRCTEDTGASSEDDELPHSPPKISLQETLERGRNYKAFPQARCTPPLAVPVSSPGVDFDTPAHFKPSLDNSAARHRMSIKPRNQRASAKRRRVPSNVHMLRSESLNDLDSSLREKEEENEHEEAARARCYSAEVLKMAKGASATGFIKPLSVSKLKPLEQTNRENKWVDSVPQQPPTQDETERCLPPKPLLHLSQTQGSSLETEALITPSAAAKPQEPQHSVLEYMPVTCPSTSQSQKSKDLVTEISQSQNNKDSVTEIIQSQNSKDLVREIIKSQNSKDSLKEIGQSQNNKDSVTEIIQSQNSKDLVREIIKSQNSKDSVKEIGQSQNNKDSVTEIIQSQNSKDLVREIIKSQTNKDSVKEISQSQNSKELVREIIQSQNSKEILKDSGQRTGPDDALQSTNPVPVLVNTHSHDPPPKMKLATKSFNSRDGMNRSSKALIQALQVQPHPRQQPLVATSTGKTMPSAVTELTAEKSSSLNPNTAAMMTGVVQDSSNLEPAQRPTAHSDGQGDQPSVDTFVPQKKRLVSGSFRFSISTARDHPRTGSLAGRGEQAGAKTEDILAKMTLQNYRVKDQPTLREEEVKPKEQPSNPLSGLKAEESVVGKTSLSSNPQEQPAVSPQEARAKELPQDPPSSDEKKDLLRKEDVSTLGVARDSGDKYGKSEKVTGGEVDREMEMKPDESKNMQENRGEDSHARSAFGVKLRATSLSLRYRSDMVRPKSKSVVRTSFPPHDPQSSDPLILLPDKHSVPEVKQDSTTQNCPVSIDDTDRGNTVAGTHPSASVPIESPSQTSDTTTLSGPPRSTSSPPPKGYKRDTQRAGSFKQGDSKIPTNPESAAQKEAEPRVCEPAWMTLAREKSRSLQQLLTCGLPGGVTAQQTTARPEPAPQTTPHPAPQTIQQYAPQTTPQPVPQTTAQPASQNTSQPIPQNTSQPAPQITPHPEPQTTPMPTPQTTSQPTPQPATPLPLQGRSQRGVSVGKTDRALVEKGQVEHTKAIPGTHVKVECGASHKAMPISKSEVKLEEKAALKIHTTETTPIASSVQQKT
ncbi:hypothetical protein AAFF_G00432580 [Aldrovandia affinis]|uniref:DUF4592 domain-containing protein n=1 Tax=Aldrovandia affinis TaxID=143900 RepID=A0AAD7SAS8_9TELE|nr:hypothetical protein AAFF_G00432580 [Aldrovandia affinis]